MALNPHFSDASANAAADAIAVRCNAGTLKIYDGAQPANANTAISTQVLLATVTFAATAFASSVAGVATANAIGSAAAVATSTATWFRALTSGAATVFDGSVGTTGANLNLNAIAIVTGATVSVTALTLTATE